MATELAKAYVQIVPSADGIKEKLEQVLGKETQNAGKKGGDNIAKGIKNAVLKLGLGALLVKSVASATSSISDLIAESFSSFAENEQLEGGVKKIFGDDAYAEVVENANNAFKTIGISANQYLETVTGFSASLINSLEGDQVAAAKLADMAMRDMADNANTFGTSIESIQNAYQGFAKGNYTMLDNLKLGFGGTEEEMERLLEKASEISEVEYDIDNFDDIIEAIHVIQDNIGIMGTSESEALGTITGASNMLKAAWDNFLGSMAQGDERIATTTQNLVDSVVAMMGQIERVLPTIIPNLINGLVDVAMALIPKLPGIINILLPPVIAGIENLLSGLMLILPELLQVLVNVLPTVIDTILTMLPLVLQTAIDLVVILAKGIIEALPTLVPAVVDIVLTLVDTLVDNLDLLIDVAIDLIVALTEGLVEALPLLAEKAPMIISKIYIAVMESLPKMLDAGGKIVLKIVSGIVASGAYLADGAIKAFNAFKTSFEKMILKAPEIGKQLMEGLKDGILGGVKKVQKAAEDVADSILKGVKDLFGIHSPSKEFAWIGEMCDEGLAEGLEGMSDTVADAKAGIRDELSKDMDFSTSLVASSALNGSMALTSSATMQSDLAGTVANAVYNALDNLTIKAEMDPKMSKFFESMRAEAVSYKRRTGNEAWA